MLLAVHGKEEFFSLLKCSLDLFVLNGFIKRKKIRRNFCKKRLNNQSTIEYSRFMNVRTKWALTSALAFKVREWGGGGLMQDFRVYCRPSPLLDNICWIFFCHVTANKRRRRGPCARSPHTHAPPFCTHPGILLVIWCTDTCGIYLPHRSGSATILATQYIINASYNQRKRFFCHLLATMIACLNIYLCF
jgi:hypothetical protein